MNPESSRTSRPSRRGSPRLRKVLRGLHHQTRELELLISGLVTFALLQAPGPVDRVFNHLRVELGEGAAYVATLTFAYGKLAIYGLVTAFVFHLVVRALWVALVGLDSVFPRGVRPERLRQGPLAMEYIRQELPPVRRLIRITDDVASVIFAVAFSLVAVFVISIPTLGGLPTVAYGASALLPGEVSAVRVFWWVWGAFMVMAVLPTLLDRAVAHRVHPGSPLRRGIKSVLRGFYRFTGYPIYEPIQLTLASNFGSRRTGTAAALVVILLGGVFFVRDIMAGTGDLHVVGSAFVPTRASEVSLEPGSTTTSETWREATITSPPSSPRWSPDPSFASSFRIDPHGPTG